MTPQNKVAAAVVALAVAVFGTAIVYSVAAADGGEVPADEIASTVVRDDSHRLDTADDGDVTLVEFVDFECESCAAAYPFVEDLRERYAGRVTFVLRYFPLPSHRNAQNAALAVEAAARQGQLEPMYRRMFDTQREWGESQDSQAAVFRGFAEDLGLDLDQYDTDVADPQVAARVQRDVDDGTDLGVTGTPTFFLDGQRLQPTSEQEFTDAIDEALAE